MTTENNNIWVTAKHANRHLLREITKDKIQQSSLSSYAAAGLSFVAIVALMQMDQLLISQVLAFASFSLAIPILIFLASFHENFIWFGPDTYEEFGKMCTTNGYYYFLTAGYCLFGLGFFLILWSVSWVVSVATLVLTLLMLLTHNYVTERLSLMLDQKIKQTQESDI